MTRIIAEEPRKGTGIRLQKQVKGNDPNRKYGISV